MWRSSLVTVKRVDADMFRRIFYVVQASQAERYGTLGDATTAKLLRTTNAHGGTIHTLYCVVLQVPEGLSSTPALLELRDDITKPKP